VFVLLALGVASLAAFAYWLRRRKRQGKATLLDPDLFQSRIFRLGISQQLLQQIALGGTMIVLPIYLQMVFEYNALEAGLSLAPLSLTMFAVALVAGKRAGQRRPGTVVRLGFGLLTGGLALLIPIVPRADSGWWLAIPLIIAGAGLGLLVSQLNNYTLAPIAEERVSEAAGVNSAAGQGQPEPVQDEIVRINTEAREVALQIALFTPILAAFLGLLNSFRMLRQPDPEPSAHAEGMALG
jgi:Major Facilitator Superfamily